MTAEELQRIALRLSNQSWCRHWLNFYCRTTDVMMAIQCCEPTSPARFAPCRVQDLERHGFELYADGNGKTDWLYLIPRTNQDGTPYVSPIQ